MTAQASTCKATGDQAILWYLIAFALKDGGYQGAWPAVGVWAARELWMDRQREQERIRRQEEGVFRIRSGDLLHATTIAEVEKTERMRDPLGAVPEVPFGHLHAVWREFLQKRPHDAELWTFACDWTTEWGAVFARRGYVWVKDQSCTPWILTSHTPKEQDVD